MRLKLFVSVFSWLVVSAITSSAFAVSLSTTRALRNLDTVLKSLRLEEVAKGTASVTVDELDYAIKRGHELQTLDEADKTAPEVQAMAKRLEEIVAFRDRLVEAQRGAREANEALRARLRVFAEETKPFSNALTLFPEASGSNQAAVNVTAERLAEGLKQLAALDKICKEKYADIQLKPCDAAARRQELATAMVQDKVMVDSKMWLNFIIDSKTSLEKKQGFLLLSGNIVHDLVYDREKGKKTLLSTHKPFFAAAGLAVPADLFAPFDKAIDELWAEVDRLAPTFHFPAKTHSDKKVEESAKSELAGFVKGAKVQKTGMLYADWDIAKNEIGIPTEKYRTGGILCKNSESKWCQYREFTAHLEYAGGGKYKSKPTYTFGPPRYQACD